MNDMISMLASGAVNGVRSENTIIEMSPPSSSHLRTSPSPRSSPIQMTIDIIDEVLMILEEDKIVL